jgi:hypothetical protein
MRTVLVGTPAFVGRIDGETRCAFWSEEPVDHGFDPQLLIAVDLARTPSAAAAKERSPSVSESTRRVRRLRLIAAAGVAGLFAAAAADRLSSTLLLVAIEPKAPPFKGDC